MEPLDPNCAQWYALHVRCNQEKNVAQSLDSRGVERFLPCYSSRRRWKDRQVTLEMPLFPGYLFVRLPLLERSKALLAPYVISLVGTRGAPAVIEEEEIENIRRGLEHGKVEPHDCLHVGQHVVIVEGIMAGMEGILLRKQNRTRVVVSLDSIARAFAVEVDAEWVKPSGSSAQWVVAHSTQPGRVTGFVGLNKSVTQQGLLNNSRDRVIVTPSHANAACAGTRQ